MKNVNSMLNYLNKNKGDPRFSKLIDEYYFMQQEGMFENRAEKREAINGWKDKVNALAEKVGDVD